MSSGMGKRGRRSICQQALLTKSLADVIHAAAKQIHPSVFQETVRGVGAEQGRLAASEWRLAHKVTRRRDIQVCVQCLKAIAQQCGWTLRVAVESEDALRVVVSEAGFTEPYETGSYLCELAAGLFAGVVAEVFGYARVFTGRCSETPPLNCVYVIQLKESEEAMAVPDIAHPHVVRGSTLLAERLVDGTLGERLTQRELQVLRLIAQGLSDKAIAMALHLSVRTVENHGARIRQKLRIDTRTGLVRFAFRNRLIEP